MIDDQRRAELEAEVMEVMERYNEAFVSGTRDDLQALVHLPVMYVTEEEVQVRDRYPFDPVKMREVLQLAKPQTTHTVAHIEETRAHLVIEGTRHRTDGSVIESIDSFYILHKKEGEWKVSMFSGIRGARC